MRVVNESMLFSQEFKDIVIADAALSLAFNMIITGAASIVSDPALFFYFLPISIIAVTLTFVLHELMHKFTAQRFAAIAAFRASPTGLAITLLSGFLGFLVGIPGATMIYSNSFTRKEEGYVSLAGPLTNFAIFLVFLAFGLLSYRNFIGSINSTFTPYFQYNSYVHNIVNMTMYISIILAFFNMLPIYPLDGSKVLRWNKQVYYAMLGITAVLLLLVGYPIFGLVFMLIMAYMFSMVYSNVRLF